MENKSRHSEQGGITVLTVLGLLVVGTVLAFSMSKASLRELSISGTIWQGVRASEASEAGLDWFLLWANKENRGVALLAEDPTNDRYRMVQALGELNTLGYWQNSEYLLDKTKLWDRAVQVESKEETEDSDMVFNNTGADFKQSTTGNQTIQSFDLIWRYLGESGVKTMSSGTGKPAGIGGPRSGRDNNLYQLVSIGKASVPLGSDYMRYRAQREMFVTMVP